MFFLCFSLAGESLHRSSIETYLFFLIIQWAEKLPSKNFALLVPSADGMATTGFSGGWFMKKQVSKHHNCP